MSTEGGLRFSRFAHRVPLGNYTAIYNSLNLEVLFLQNGIAERLTSTLGDNIPEAESVSLAGELKRKGILIEADDDELAGYRNIQKQLETLPVRILYLLLTEQCNFACRYCFIVGGMPTGHSRARMTPKVAKAGVDLFARTVATSSKTPGHFQVIFYGGEPLLNFKTLVFALKYIHKLQEEDRLPDNLGFILNTNASLVTKEIAEILARYGVTAAVSIDGRQEIHDRERVYYSGRGTFKATMKGYQILKEAGVKVSVSCTISEIGVHHLPETISWFIDELGIQSLGFNILRESEGMQISDPRYGHWASEALIACFKIARERGVYEDRMMRKVSSFVSKQPYLNDCAGCGQQIVIAPTGEVGVCHGAVGKRSWFVPNTPDLNPLTHPYWAEWRRRSPFSMSECLNCIALGICGGGCPYEVYLKTGTIWSLDEAFCIHAKKTLEFLIRDLFEKITRLPAKAKTE